MIIRRVGTILLGTGFVMLTTAAFIRDPASLDANIGAGGLTLVGIPVGAFGLAMILARFLHAAWRERRPQKRRSGEI